MRYSVRENKTRRRQKSKVKKILHNSKKKEIVLLHLVRKSAI